MDEIPDTVQTALETVTVADRTCLEAGAGAGNMSMALQAAGAARVVAVTNNRNHAVDVVARRPGDTIEVVYGDLVETPVPTGTIDVVTAHALCNVISPAVLDGVIDELTRVTRPGGQLVVVDYAPLPPGLVADVFAVENAIDYLTDGRPAYSFYPETLLQSLFEARGWTCIDETIVLDPVSWSAELLNEHLDIATAKLDELPPEFVPGFEQYLETLEQDVPSDGVEVGEYYALTFERKRHSQA